MCKECGRQFCPPACPEFRHVLAGRGKAENYCQLCGGAVYPGEIYYRLGEAAVCYDCEKMMTSGERKRLFGSAETSLSLGS